MSDELCGNFSSSPAPLKTFLLPDDFQVWSLPYLKQNSLGALLSHVCDNKMTHLTLYP